MEIQILKAVADKDLREALWKIYEETLISDSEKYPHNQVNYTYDQFLNAMADETVVKFVLMDDNKPLGFAIVINSQHPEQSPWTNFQAFFNKIGGNRKGFYYVNVLAVDPTAQRKGMGRKIIESIIDWSIAQQRGKPFGGFDTPREKRHLVDLVRECCEKKGFTVELIGSQDYYLISPAQ
jgi:GNAT superfamily N-acetyltransferase